jgi:hypothetical protein
MTLSALKSLHPKLGTCSLNCLGIPDDSEIVFERANPTTRPSIPVSLTSFVSPGNFNDLGFVERILPLPSDKDGRNIGLQSRDVPVMHAEISTEQGGPPKLDLHIPSERISDSFPPGTLKSHSGSQFSTLGVGTNSSGISAGRRDIIGLSQSEESAVIAPVLVRVRAPLVILRLKHFSTSLDYYDSCIHSPPIRSCPPLPLKSLRHPFSPKSRFNTFQLPPPERSVPSPVPGRLQFPQAPQCRRVLALLVALSAIASFFLTTMVMVPIRQG